MPEKTSMIKTKTFSGSHEHSVKYKSKLGTYPRQLTKPIPHALKIFLINLFEIILSNWTNHVQITRFNNNNFQFRKNKHGCGFPYCCVKKDTSYLQLYLSQKNNWHLSPCCYSKNILKYKNIKNLKLSFYIFHWMTCFSRIS